MDYTFHSQNQTFLMYCSFCDSNHQQHQVRQNGNKANHLPSIQKLFFFLFVNIKTTSIKEVNQSAKGLRHILKDQSKNEKLLKKPPLKQYWLTLLKSNLKYQQNVELNLRETDVLHNWYYLSPITFVTIWNQQCFKYQNLWPLTLLECAIYKLVFPRTTNL